MFIIKVGILEGWIGMQKKSIFSNKVQRNQAFNKIYPNGLSKSTMIGFSCFDLYFREAHEF